MKRGRDDIWCPESAGTGYVIILMWSALHLKAGKWIYGWSCKCPFPARLRSNATKHANLDPTSYASHSKPHQCIYTHKNIK